MTPNESLTVYFSPASRLSDIRALLDSYAVQLERAGLVYLRAPIHFFVYRLGPPPAEVAGDTPFSLSCSALSLRTMATF